MSSTHASRLESGGVVVNQQEGILQTAAAPHVGQYPLIFIMIAHETIIVQRFLILQVVIPILFETLALGGKILIGNFFNSLLRDQL